jgi:hypothetical protein
MSNLMFLDRDKNEEQKYRDSFINDVEFNKQLLEDLSKVPNLVICSQLNKYIYGCRSRLPYIHHLLFVIFSENPQKPNYDILGFEFNNSDTLKIIRLLWEYMDLSNIHLYLELLALPNPNDYEEDGNGNFKCKYEKSELPSEKECENNLVEFQSHELIVIDDAKESDNPIINAIFGNVENRHISYGNVLSSNDKENIKIVIQALLNKNRDGKPIVIDLAMGKGKSVILSEFIKYMCKVDETFSAIIVKKTLDEAKEFIMELGVRDTEKHLINGGNTALENIYEKHEDKFIAKLIRGFNTKDCLKYLEAFFGDSNFDEDDFNYDLCIGCSISECKVKLSKYRHKEHRVLVITHARLFLSNDNNNEILGSISEWEDEDGKKHKRKMLLIDEKIDTFRLDNFRLNDWDNYKNRIISSNLDNEIKEQVHKVDNYLRNLNYPVKSGEVVIINPCNLDLQLDAKTIGFLLKEKCDIKKINSINKFLKYGGYCGRNWKGKKEEILSYCKYIDAKEYSKNFEKCIILDATYKNDYDYCKSDVKFAQNLNNHDNYKVDIHYNSLVSTSKSSIIDCGNYNENVELICKDIKDAVDYTKKKTLVVVYKEMEDYIGKKYFFKRDIENQLKKLNIDIDCKVIHFGQYTTGVNHLREFETIIIIGQLDKGTYYYRCKGLNLGLDEMKVKTNEYLIDSIQLIGRTAIRNGKKVDVYILGRYDDSVNQLKNYFKGIYYTWVTKNCRFRSGKTICTDK